MSFQLQSMKSYKTNGLLRMQHVYKYIANNSSKFYAVRLRKTFKLNGEKNKGVMMKAQSFFLPTTIYEQFLPKRILIVKNLKQNSICIKEYENSCLPNRDID